MARFPLKEAEIAALAEAMITGLTANIAIYPAPPVEVLDLTAAKTARFNSYYPKSALICEICC